MSDDLDQGSYTGTADEQARQAALDVAESRRQNPNAFVDRYLRGNYEDQVHIRDEEKTRGAQSKNQNAPGLDPKATAEALARYRDGRQAQMNVELQANYGLDPATGEPIADQPQPQQPQPEAPAYEHPEVAAERERAYVAIAQAQQQAAAAQAQADQIAQHHFNLAYGHLTAEFADIQTEADLAFLAQVDPPRFVRFQAAKAAIESGLGELQGQAARQQQQFDAWAQTEDHKFAQAHPELRDPVARAQVEEALIRTAQQVYGVSPQELAHAYATNPALRSAAGQAMMYNALRFHQAQESARRPSSRPIPTVQRPGMARGRNADIEGAIQDHTKDLDRGGGVRAAAKLLIARRAARE